MHKKRFIVRLTVGCAVLAVLVPSGALLTYLFQGSGVFIAAFSAVVALSVGAITVLGALSDFRDRDHWYEQILDSVYLPLSVTNLDMKWTFINSAVKEIIGVSREQVMGQHCSNWNADICGTEKCGVAMLRRGLSTSYFTNEGIDRNFQVDTNYLYDRKDKKKKIGHVEIVSDITTKVRLDSAVEHLKSSSESLAGRIENEASTTTEISATAKAFSQSLQSITGSTEKQYEIIEETVSALEEMSSSIRSVAQNAGEVSGKSRESVNAAEHGREVIKDTIEGIGEISTSLTAISEEIARLSEKTNRVDDILKVIDGIAAQTNLLSMNAAIEAAHAGDAGRGFSVVAAEIRKLAENAQVSSREIEKILGEIKLGVEGTLGISDQVRSTAEQNVGNIGSSVESLERIVSNVTVIDKMIAEVDGTTAEQTTSTAGILENTKHLLSI